MKSKFQIVSKKGEVKKSPPETIIEDSSDEEMLLEFLKQQVSDLEESMKNNKRIPLQRAAIIFCFGESDSFEESLQQFQFVSFNIPTSEFFLLVDTMKTKYIQDITQS